jgi:hypothetical protein
VLYEKKQTLQDLFNEINSENPAWVTLTLFFLEAMKTMVLQTLATTKTLDFMNATELDYLWSVTPIIQTRFNQEGP